MQKVRIGLTGLAIVFLFVLLSAAVFTLLGQGTLTRDAQRSLGNHSGTGETPKEPLAELGVAPGNAPTVPDTNATSRPEPVASPPATAAATPPLPARAGR